MAIQDFIGWERYDSIEIQASQVPGDLVDFPVLLTEDCLPDEYLDLDNPNSGRSDGQDLIIANGSWDRLSMEIVDVSKNTDPANATAEVYAKIDSVSSSVGTVLRCVYGHPGATQPAAGDPFGSEDVWSNGYLFVFHGDDSDDSAGNITTQGYDGGFSSGKIGQAFNFNGSTQELDLTGVAGDLSEVTYESWINPDVLPSSGFQAIVNMDGLVSGSARFQIYNPNDALRLSITGNTPEIAESSFSLTTTWQHVSATYNANVGETDFRRNFSTLENFTYTTSINLDPDLGYTIGAFWDSGFQRHFDGLIDEVRVSTVVRSANWLQASYNNQNSPSMFVVPDNNPQDLIIPIKVNYSEKGTVSIGAGATSNSATFGQVITEGKTLLTFTYRIGSTAPGDGSVRALLSPTGVTFSRNNTGAAVTVEYRIIEFTSGSGIEVVHGSFSSFLSGLNQIPITPKNPNLSWIFYSNQNSGSSWGNNEFMKIEFDATGENLNVTSEDSGTSGKILQYQLITYQQSSVKKYGVTISANPSNQTITDVDLLKTFVIGSFTTTSSLHTFDELYKLTLNSSTELGRDKYASLLSSEVLEHVVEILDDGISVLQHTGTIASGISNQNDTLAKSVSDERSLIILGSEFPHLTPSDSANDSAGLSALALDLTGPNTLNVQRNATGSEAKYTVFILSFTSGIGKLINGGLVNNGLVGGRLVG